MANKLAFAHFSSSFPASQSFYAILHSSLIAIKSAHFISGQDDTHLTREDTPLF